MRATSGDEEENILRRFRFFATTETVTPNWFKVRRILAFDRVSQIVKFALEKNLSENATDNLTLLFEKLNDVSGNSALSYYEIDEVEYDDVLNIFVRVNSSGTYLSKTDLLFSTIVSYWKGGRDAMENLLAEINRAGNGFSFGTDFLMRGCLVLSDSPINLKIESFKKTNVMSVSKEWEKIADSFRKLVSFLTESGYEDSYITSYNALLPILYYFHKGGKLTVDNLREFKKYLAVAQIKNLFGVASNAAISKTRDALQRIDCRKTAFSLELFKEITLVGNRNFFVDEGTLEMCFEYDLGPYTFMLLSILYPDIKMNQVKWHQDHLHPASGFENRKIKSLNLEKKVVERWQRERNRLFNLQILVDTENESKNDTPLIEWVNKGNDFRFRPDNCSLELENFDVFQRERKKLMKEYLRRAMGLNDSDKTAAPKTENGF